MKVLIATDGTPWSHDALREAARLLPLKDAEVHVVAIADVVPAMFGLAATASGAALVVERAAAAAAIDSARAVGLLAGLGIPAIAHEREGEPPREILELARELAPDLIVLGAHGKYALERLFFGSTSDEVIHHWAGAVLVVRPRAVS